MRALLVTTSHFCEVVVFRSRTVPVHHVPVFQQIGNNLKGFHEPLPQSPDQTLALTVLYVADLFPPRSEAAMQSDASPLEPPPRSRFRAGNLHRKTPCNPQSDADMQSDPNPQPPQPNTQTLKINGSSPTAPRRASAGEERLAELQGVRARPPKFLKSSTLRMVKGTSLIRKRQPPRSTAGPFASA